MIEGKAKISEPSEILSQVMMMLGASKSPLNGKRVLVTVGGTSERIDTVRSITSQSSGRMGTAIISELLRAGSKVTAVYGLSSYEPPDGATVTRVESSIQMAKAISAHLKKKRYDILVMAAAVSDYAPRPKKGKISGGRSITLKLEKTPKIIDGS